MSAIELAGVVIVEGGKLLVAHRKTPDLEQYEVIGGKRKPVETLGKTAIREAHEEAGIGVRLLGESTLFGFTQHDQDYDYHLFPAHIISGAPSVREPHLHDSISYISPRGLRLVSGITISPPLDYVLTELSHGSYDRYFSSVA